VSNAAATTSTSTASEMSDQQLCERIAHLEGSEQSSWKVQHSHGLTERYTSYDDAVDALREVYGEDIEVEGTEHELLTDHCARALVWQDEESARNDDGSRAVASIRLFWVQP
jgi:hypothetical protein